MDENIDINIKNNSSVATYEIQYIKAEFREIHQFSLFLSLSLSLSLSISLSLSHSLPLAPSLPRSLPLPLSPSLSRSCSLLEGSTNCYI
jgi:hypothetical protein